MNIDYQRKSQEIIDWIIKTVHFAGFKKVVVGLSGGIDSAVSATLAVRGLRPENVSVAMLPYGEMNKTHLNDAKMIADYLEIPEKNRVTIDIKKAVDEIISTINDEPTNHELTKEICRGNIMARVRMIYIFDLAKKTNALVVGTENKTEQILGYFTRFGDSASDLEPITVLYKTQVWEMGKFLGIPEKIISKTPTAGLWHEQTDEGELGFTYKQADQVLYFTFDQKLSVDEIISKGIAKNVVEKVLETVTRNEFKQKVPYIFGS